MNNFVLEAYKGQNGSLENPAALACLVSAAIRARIEFSSYMRASIASSSVV